MNRRYIYLAFENLKRCIHKKTTLVSIIGFAFIMGYATSIFIIEESSLKVNFNSNDFVIFFLNDFTISRVFLSILFLIFLVGMFLNNEVNYMYVSRLAESKDIFKSWAVSIFLCAISFVTFAIGVLFLIGGMLKNYNSLWSSGSLEMFKQRGLIEITNLYSPLITIMISIWMVTMLMIIVGFLFYIGYCITKGIGLGIFINFIGIMFSGLSIYFKIDWLAKIFPNTSSLLILNNVNKDKIYSLFQYSYIYIIGFLIILLLTSYGLSKKYLKIKI